MILISYFELQVKEQTWKFSAIKKQMVILLPQDVPEIKVPKSRTTNQMLSTINIENSEFAVIYWIT
jgi:hypothetical protein